MSTARSLLAYLLLGLPLAGFASDDNRLIFDAVLDGDTAALEAELGRGKTAEAKEAGARTALMAAVGMSKPEVVEFLLNKGVDVNARNAEGTTPLMVAARDGNTKIVQLLLEHGAERDAKDNDGNTAMTLARQGINDEASAERKALGGGRRRDVIRILGGTTAVGEIYHIIPKSEWAAAKTAGVYRPRSLETERFIHCSAAGVVIETANMFFKGRKDLLLLKIEVGKLSSPVKYEAAAGRAALFPHIYGPLNIDAVTSVADLRPKSDGTFEPPAGLNP